MEHFCFVTAIERFRTWARSGDAGCIARIGDVRWQVLAIEVEKFSLHRDPAKAASLLLIWAPFSGG